MSRCASDQYPKRQSHRGERSIPELPELEVVTNTIHWTTLWGELLDYNLETFLPTPNVAERLAASGTEVITIQPANFPLEGSDT